MRQLRGSVSYLDLLVQLPHSLCVGPCSNIDTPQLRGNVNLNMHTQHDEYL